MCLREMGWDSVDSIYVPEDRGKWPVLENTNEPPSPPPPPPPPPSGPVCLCPRCTAALGLLYSPEYSIQHKFNNPVPLIKRQRSFAEAVLTSFGSTSEFPKMFNTDKLTLRSNR
jgi:hypothetical protein